MKNNKYLPIVIVAILLLLISAFAFYFVFSKSNLTNKLALVSTPSSQLMSSVDKMNNLESMYIEYKTTVNSRITQASTGKLPH